MSTLGLGGEGFRWFVGKVEDREGDPRMLGRVKVRMYNMHPTKKSLIPTDELPWATILGSPNSAGHQKIGVSPTGILNESIVIGFFLDGNDGNQPVIMGTIAAIPDNIDEKNDIPPEAREKNEVVKDYDSENGPFRGEPVTAYATNYPYNKVIRTERGHVIEVDDTPGDERIHVYHTSGTYWEINQEGRLVHKCVDNSYEVVLENKDVHVLGNVNVKVDGNVNMEVDGNVDAHIHGSTIAETDGNLHVTAHGNINATTDGNFNLAAGGNIAMKAGGTINLSGGGSLGITASGGAAIDAPRIDLNSGVAVEVTPEQAASSNW